MFHQRQSLSFAFEHGVDGAVGAVHDLQRDTLSIKPTGALCPVHFAHATVANDLTDSPGPNECACFESSWFLDPFASLSQHEARIRVERLQQSVRRG